MRTRMLMVAVLVAGGVIGGGAQPAAAASLGEGSLDPSFGGDGKVTTAIGTEAGAAAIAIQSDGKIVTAGRVGGLFLGRFAVVRYNPGGSLDTTFSGDGKVRTAIGSRRAAAWDVAIQPDGKIVAAGVARFPGGQRIAVVQYNPDGSLDTTFSGDGKVTTAIGLSAWASAVAVQADGKIVAAGFARFSDRRKFAVVRYNPNGSLDTTFSGDGKVTTAIGSGRALASDVAIQPDGKIVAAGFARFPGGQRIAVVRYKPNGSLDTTFSGDGKVATAFARGASADGVAIQPDGKIVAAGFTPAPDFAGFAVVRYNPNGSLDTSFSGDGKVTTAIGSVAVAHAVAIQADGKIVAAGYNEVADRYATFAVVRYNRGGSLDTTFSGDGKVRTAIGGTAWAYAAAIQADGKIVAAGSAAFGGHLRLAVARYIG